MVQEIKKIFDLIENNERWSINLVKLNVSKSNGIKYIVEELSDFDGNGIGKTVKEISKIYTEGDKANKYTSIEKYNSDIVSDVIYEIDTTDVLIKDSYSLLITSLSNPDKENEPTKMKYDCYVLKSSVKQNGEDIPIKLVFMNNPVKILKNRFIKIKEKYTEITDKVIWLSLSIDMIIWNGKVYSFNNSCEKLFNMERTYKIICQENIQQIKNTDIISDIDLFANVASSGHNPKKFVSFNRDYLEKLKDSNIRSNISVKFNIPLKDGKFDTSKPKASEDLIKILCGKGKIDPFNDTPVEVAGAKEWK